MATCKTVCSLGGVVRQRFLLTFMMFMCIVNTYTMRVSLNYALVKMCKKEKLLVDNTFDWDHRIQGLIKSSFYWGYIITHLPGGYLADRFGGKYVVFFGLASTTLATALIPITARHGGWEGLVVLRVVTGLGEGVVFPAIGTILSRWVPLAERSRVGTAVMTGAQAGNVVTNGLTGILLSLWEWDYTFYFYSLLGVLFCLFWCLLCYSIPEDHPYITEKELAYLQETVMPKKNVKPVPWKAILTSCPVWGLIIGQMGHDWGLFTMVHELPIYLNDVLNFDIRTNGLLLAMPYLAMWILSLLCSVLADFMITRNIMSIVNVRRVFTASASVIPAIGIAAAPFPSDRDVVVAFLTVGLAGMAGYYPGMRVNALDLTKNYAGTVIALHNGMGAVSGLVSPILIGFLTPHSTLPEWRKCFFITAGILVISCLFYTLVAKGERQIWDYQDDETPPEPKRKSEGTDSTTEKHWWTCFWPFGEK